MNFTKRCGSCKYFKRSYYDRESREYIGFCIHSRHIKRAKPFEVGGKSGKCRFHIWEKKGRGIEKKGAG